MEIQQHDGVVVDVAGLGRALLSFCERERGVAGEERGAQGCEVLSSLPPTIHSSPGGLERHLGPPPHAPRVGNPRGGVPPCLGGQGNPFPPWPPPPLGDPISQGWRTPRGLYKGGGGRAATYSLGRLPPPLQHLSLPLALGEALPGSLLLPPPRRRAAGSPSTSPSPLLDQEGGDVAAPYVC